MSVFRIDLLKGQGVPAKNRPEGIIVAAVTVAVPVIVGVVMLVFYLCNEITISVQSRAMVGYEKRIDHLSDSVELQKSFEEKKNNMSNSLLEVKSSITRHTQWSPVLEVLVKNLPDSLVLTRLGVEQRFVKRKMPRKDDSKRMIDVTVPVRTLQMDVSGSQRYNCDKAVRDFRDRLRFSSLLEPMLEDIRVSQQVDTLEGHDVVSYKIDCVFKPEL